MTEQKNEQRYVFLESFLSHKKLHQAHLKWAIKSSEIKLALSHHKNFADTKLVVHHVISYFHTKYFQVEPGKACVFRMELLKIETTMLTIEATIIIISMISNSSEKIPLNRLFRSRALFFSCMQALISPGLYQSKVWFFLFQDCIPCPICKLYALCFA